MIVLSQTPESGEPEIKDYVPYETVIGFAKLEMFLNALGLNLEAEFETNDLDGLVGVEFRARTRNEEFNKILSTRIEEYLPAPELENPDQFAKDYIDRVNFAKDRDEFRKDMEADLAKENRRPKRKSRCGVKLSLPAGVLSSAESVRIALDKMQAEGCGFNPSLISVARGLFFSAVGQTRAIKLMTERAEFLGVAPRRMHEILRAVGKVYHAAAFQTGERNGDGWAAIKADVPRTENLCETGATAHQLERSSPVDPATLKTWPLLRALFPDRKTLLCIGNDESSVVVIQRDAELRPENLQFIVPNGMTSYTGRNKEGFISVRTLSNTGPEIIALAIDDFNSHFSVPQPRIPMNPSSKNIPLICTTIVTAGQSRATGSTSIPPIFLAGSNSPSTNLRISGANHPPRFG
jgi:hypothetical protein